MLYWNPSTLVIPLGGGLVRLFQVVARRNVVATLPVVELVDRCQDGLEDSAARDLYASIGDRLRMADATAFTLWDNAYRNSDMYEPVAPEALETLPFNDAVELLTECGIVSATWPAVHDFPKRGFADCHRGSFHERVGTEALFHRTTPAEWWAAQKFTPDNSAIRPTPYRFIEEAFLDRYFAENAGGLDILEVGCGTGYFTARMARHAKTVVGMDHNANYLAVARKMYPRDAHRNLEFVQEDIIHLGGNDDCLRPGRFDRVVMIDTFLFLFANTYQNVLFEHRDEILKNLARLMRPGGQLLIMDPHPLWLCPWLGADDRPFGILTEYRHRRFKVSPNLEEISGLLYKNDLRIRRVLEPDVDPAYAAVDPRAYAFLREVPQWWFLEVEAARA